MKRWSIILVMALSAIPVANAAKDGDLATQSVGEIGVSVDLVPPGKKISITGLRDIDFSKTIGDTPNADETINACVYMDDSGVYTVEVEAGALTDGNLFYPYDVSITQILSSSPTLELSVAGTDQTAEKDGFMPSSDSSCSSNDHLMITFKDKGTDTISEAFSASSTVILTLTPE